MSQCNTPRSLRTLFQADVKAITGYTGDFAVEAVYTALDSSTSETIKGIFKNRFEVMPIVSENVANGDTVFIGSIDKLQDAKQGDTFVIDVPTYVDGLLTLVPTTYYALRADPNTLNGKVVVTLSTDNPRT